MIDLPDHVHVAQVWPTAQHGDFFTGLWTSVSIERLIISLWVGCSKIWQNTSWLYSITVCGEVKVHKGRSNFRIFYFRTQNAHTKISTVWKFPTIWYKSIIYKQVVKTAFSMSDVVDCLVVLTTFSCTNWGAMLRRSCTEFGTVNAGF